MHQARYFRELATRCYKLGRTCFDLDAARELNDIGDRIHGLPTIIIAALGSLALRAKFREAA